MATITSNISSYTDPKIKQLEEQSGLSPEALADLKSKSSGRALLYMAFLTIVVDPSIEAGTVIEYTSETGVVDSAVFGKTVVDWLRNIAQNSRYAKEYKNTPVGKNEKNSVLEDNGKEGVVAAANPQNMPNTPVTGPTKHSGILAENLLNKIHPKFTETLETYCTFIKSRAYLALPLTAFGSLQSAVSQINGVVGALQKLIFSVYKGIMKAIQQFYSYINGIITQIQKYVMSLIDSIIPLDLICMILEAIQVIMDDINFFSSLFGQNGSVFKYLNTFQTYLNQASTLVSNPFTTLSAYMPSEVQNLIDMVEQIGSDPNGFLADQLSNYGYAWVLNGLQGDILGAVVNKYGAQYAAIGPVGTLLNSSESYSRSMGSYNSTSATIGPNVYRGNSGKNLDTNLNPVDYFQTSVNDFIKNVGDSAKNLQTQVGNIF